MTYVQALEEARRAYFTALMEQTHGNVAEVARIAGVNRSHCYELLERVGLHESRKQNAGNGVWQSLRA